MKKLIPIICFGLAACSSPETPETDAPDDAAMSIKTTEVQSSPSEGVMDSYKYDIPDGLPSFLQGMWSVDGVSDPGRPYYFFEGNRVSLSYVEEGERITQGSDNFRPVKSCADLKYDPMGRGVQLGQGVNGDMPICWDLKSISANSLNVHIMNEALSLVRVELDPGQTLGTTPALAGRWISSDDPQITLLFEGKHLTEFYAGENMGRGTITFLDNCANKISISDGAKSIGAMLYAKDGTNVCFKLLDVGEKVLKVSMDGRGNLLTYEREN